ncbi:MAG: hypothetical protein ABIJ39_08400 [Chloroflexota bacterium]
MTATTNSAIGKTTRSQFWMRMGIGVALAVASAVMLTMAFPPYPFWPLIFIAAIPFLLAQSHVLPGKWSSLAGMVFFMEPNPLVNPRKDPVTG